MIKPILPFQLTSWKKFLLLLLLLSLKTINGVAQNYVNITLADPVGGNGNPTTTGATQDYLINAKGGYNGIGIGWGANLYSASEVGSSNKIYDLTWVSKSYINTSGKDFDFKDVDVWMYHFNSDAFPDNNRPDVQSGIISGATNITKVATGKSLIVKSPSSGQCIFTLTLDTPFDYVAGNNLVIYLEKKIPYTPSVNEGPVFMHNIESNGKKRRISNWADGTISNPLPATHNSSASQKSFARIMFNVGFSNTIPFDGVNGASGNKMTQCLIPVCTTPVISNKSATICSNNPFSFSPINTLPDVVPVGTTYKWTFTDNPNVTGEASETIGKTSIASASNLINTSNTSQDVVYTVTPTSGTCVGNPFTLTLTIKNKPNKPSFSGITQPTCNSLGSVPVLNYLASPATYTFNPSNGISINSNGKILASSGKYKFVVSLDGCNSDSSDLLTMSDVPGKPVLEGPSSVCVGSEITLKAWTDNTKNTKSTPNGTTPWAVKTSSNDLDTVSLTLGTDPTVTSNNIKGLKAVSHLKPGEATIVFTNNSGCTAEHTVKVNPKPVVPVLSHIPSNPLVYTGNVADTVCKGSSVEFTLLGGTIGDKVYFKDSLITPSYIVKAQNIFNRKNVLADINVVIDSVSNGLCRINALPLKIVMADTALSLKSFPTSKCGLNDGKIEVILSHIGRLSWTSNNLIPPITGSKDIISINSAYTIANLKKGSYTATYNNGGCLLSKNITISDPNRPYLEVSSTSNPLSICAGDSILLTVWNDNTKTTKSIPKSTFALRWVSDKNNVTFKDSTNNLFTITKVIGALGGDSKITYTDINDCTTDTMITINSAGVPTTIINPADLKQQFCVADNAKVSNLKPSGLFWFEERGKTNLAPTTLLKKQFYYAAIRDAANGCFTKKEDRVKVEVVINPNPSEPSSVDQTQSFCKIDDPDVSKLQISGPVGNYKWFLKSGSTLTPKIATDKLEKSTYVIKYYQDGCLSLNGVDVDVDLITVPDPQAPTQKLCANNQVPLTLGGLYDPSNTNYYYYDLLNNPILQSQPVAVGEQYKVKQFGNGCLSNAITVTIGISNGPTIDPNPYNLTPALCKINNPTLTTIEASYPSLPKNGSLHWYDAQNSLLTNELNKNVTLGDITNKYWIALKDADGCFSKKQEVVFSIDPGKKPDLKPIELCKTTDYTLNDLSASNITNPTGILKWYLSQTGSSFAPSSIPKNSTQEYWASYKTIASDCEGERVKLTISWLESFTKLEISQLDTIVCPGGNINFKTVLSPSINTPVYQWYVNDAKVGANSSLYWSKTLKSKDKITVNVTSKDFCPTTATIYVRMDSLRLSMNVPTMVYLKSPAVNLIGYPSGGVFSGKGVANNKFDPSVLGVGNKTVTYSYKNANNCSSEISQKVVVYDTVPNNCHTTTYDTVKVNVTDTVSILKIKFKLTTGIKANQETSLRVYPNPTSDILLIEAADEKALAGYRYKMVDAAGKEVYNQPVKSIITEISLKSFGAAGTYFFEVFDEKLQRVVSKKIILD